MLTGDARRIRLAKMRDEYRLALRRVMEKSGVPVSYAEAYGEMLAAVEAIADNPAEVIQRQAKVCRDEYCQPHGGSYENIRESQWRRLK